MEPKATHGFFDSTRRNLLKGAGAMLGTGLLAKAAEASDTPSQNMSDEQDYILSSCLNCNTGCGIKCRIEDGIVSKIDGNPYNPFNMVPHLPMAATYQEAVHVDGPLCPKGQAGIQMAYDPYRIRKVLKRAGKRGENKWTSIPFDQAITEIVEGGKLFADVPGEENRHVEGLRSIRSLTDNAAMKRMSKDIKEFWNEKDKAKKAELLQAFRTSHADHLDKLIDPDHPDLGPKNNQFVISWGRLKNGRKEFLSRLGNAFGTNNLHGHTTVCQGSLYFACKAISDKYSGGKFSGGKKFYWQTDIEGAEYVVFVGANLLEANYGPTNRSVRLMEKIESGKTRIAVVDPRFSKLAAKAQHWLPIRPGEDGALAMAFISHMLRNNGYDAKFLAAANNAAALEIGETSWTNSTWLVEIKDGKPGKFVRASDLGMAKPEKRIHSVDPKDPTKDEEYEEKFFLVMSGGEPVVLDESDAAKPVFGDLFVDARIKGPDGAEVHVKTPMQLLLESSGEKSFEGWCEQAGLDAKQTMAVVEEFVRHRKKASVDIHRGVAQHTNGFYNVLSWMTVNMLAGNFDWKGGMSASSTYAFDGRKGGPFDLGKVPGKMSSFGVSLIRHEMDYERTSLFNGYPARRNWYPLSSDVYEEIVPSIGDAYPYGAKALFLYMGAPTYALPAGNTNIPVLADVEKLPLFFASDIGVGPSSMYADYIFPDLSYLERWEFQGSHPNMVLKIEAIRQPAVAPIPESCKVYGQEMPICLESTMMALAEKLGLKSFGPGAFGEAGDLLRPEHLYLRGVANIATGTKPGEEVPDASPEEMKSFLRARRHLPKSVFDESVWKAAVGEALWPKVVYLLNRGGRFEAYAKGWNGEKLGHPFKGLLNLYQEKTASKKHSGTGKSYPGYARYVPFATYLGKGKEAFSGNDDLQLITHRTVTRTKSRTAASPWLHALEPENGMLLNPKDATRLGLRHGDKVKVVSASNPDGEWDLGNGDKKAMVGKVVVDEGIRPGVTTFTLGYGNWASGGCDVEVDGEVVLADPRRDTGIHANAAMWTDPGLRNNTCLIDPLGGSVSFYDTHVRLVKV